MEKLRKPVSVYKYAKSCLQYFFGIHLGNVEIVDNVEQGQIIY